MSELQFGPDGLLYGTTSGDDDNSPAGLYRFHPVTGETTLVGETGLTGVNGLMLVGEQGNVDCVDLDTTGAEVLAINRTCGPVAAIAGATDVECQSPAGATVSLDGSGSSDVTSTPGTNDSLTIFEWFGDYGSPAQRSLGTSAQLTVDLPIGEHALTLVVTNRFGDVGTETVQVSVQDSVAPALSLDVAPTVLWPPNHRLVEVGASASATDLCSTTVVRIVSVTSSEPDDAPGVGDGTTTGDIQGVEPSVADTGFLLRAERSGSGPGRTYTVAYEAVDGAGNVSRKEALVVVPHGSGSDLDPLEVYVGKAPGGARVEWTEAPGAVSYHAIRGSVSAIRPKPSQIDLGAVECLARGVPSGSILAAEDEGVPAPGQAFFYLVEYDDGVASSYGSEDVGAPRILGSGGCR